MIFNQSNNLNTAKLEEQGKAMLARLDELIIILRRIEERLSEVQE